MSLADRLSTDRPRGRVGGLPHGGTDLAIRVLGLATLLLLTPTETHPTCAYIWVSTPDSQPGVVLLVLSQIMATLGVLLPWRHRLAPWLALALLVLGNGWIVHSAGHVARTDLLVPGYWALPPLAMAMRSLSRRGYVAFAVMATLTMMATMMVGDWHPTRVAISDLVFVAMPISEVLFFGDSLIILAAARDWSIERHRRAVEVREREEAHAQAAREAARMLHDHVLHALQALSRSIDPELAITECAQAHAAMTQRPTQATTARVEELLAADPAVEQAGAQIVGSTDPLPLPVAQSIAAAAHEALSNVVRHAHANQVAVVLHQHDHTVVVRVLDDGVGFDPRERPVGRLGMGSSIFDRMDDVGGIARTLSRPGAGTTVELTWPRPPDAPHDWRDAPDQLVRRSLSRTAWPGLATGTVMSLVASGLLPGHHQLMLVVGVVAMGIGWVGAATLRRRSLGPLAILSLCLLAAAVWILNLWAAPSVITYDYELWMAWAATALLHLVVVSERLQAGLLAVLAWGVLQVTGFYWLVRDWSVIGYWSSVITAGAGESAITLLTLVVARRFADQEASAARLGTQVRTAAARLMLSSQLEQYWSARVTDEALPLLDEVATRQLRPDLPETREQARALEMALRDELLLGPQQAPLLAQLAAARRAGWQVTSTLSPDDPQPVLDAARELLGALGEPDRRGQGVTISSSGDRSTAVVLAPGDEQSLRWQRTLAALGGVAEVDPDFVRLALPAQAR